MSQLRLVIGTLVLALAAAAAPSGAAPRDAALSAKHPTLTWQGSVEGPAPFECSGPGASGCDVRDLVVDAARGAWITISVDDQGANLRVTHRGRLVGSGGLNLNTNKNNTTTPSTTFQQVSAGRVTYQVAVGNAAAAPVNPMPYKGTARLAGTAFDRAGDCGSTTGYNHLQDADAGETRRFSVRLVADPKDAAEVRAAGRTLREIYRRINVDARVSHDFMPLVDDGTYPYVQVRRKYGGVRPAGVDVVYVMSDLFPGGFSDCLGGIAYEEMAFATGSLHYTVQGTAGVDRVPAAMVAAHEIGHLLGAQHHEFNCVEAAPQQVAQPPSDGWTAPCTVMSPTAVTASETFSSAERSTIRHFVKTYAGKRF